MSCSSPPGYRETVLESLPQVFTLDGVDRFGNPGEESPTDIPGLEDFLEYLLHTDANVSGRTVMFLLMLFAFFPFSFNTITMLDTYSLQSNKLHS